LKSRNEEVSAYKEVIEENYQKNEAQQKKFKLRKKYHDDNELI